MEPSPVESAGGLRKYSRILGGAGGDSGDSVGRGGVETNQKRSEPNLCTSERSARTSEREEEAPAPMNEPFAPENEQKRTEPRLTWIGAVGGGGATIVQATTILISSNPVLIRLRSWLEITSRFGQIRTRSQPNVWMQHKSSCVRPTMFKWGMVWVWIL